MPMDHVVVFGDSLSDIGRKWKQPMGRVAGNISENSLRMLAVSATGRFSDSKNWTDYMFEAATGQSLIAPTREATRLASGEYHRLSSRWIKPPGGSRFRYANYAVGGATGGNQDDFTKKVGLTSFGDQVCEFVEDFQSLPEFSGSHRPALNAGRFLFIVMFGANDIYTDEKKTNVSHQIAGEIVKRCEVLSTCVGQRGATAHFVVAGVANPEQSVFYSSQLADKRMRAEAFRHQFQLSDARYVRNNSLQNRLSRAEAEYHASSAEKKEREFREKCSKLRQQAVCLNNCLLKACHTKDWHFFSMREALLLLEDDSPFLNIDAQKAQSVEHFQLTSHKKGNIHFADPNDPRLKLPTGQHALFTADQKHPTSIGYEYLWTRMSALLQAEDLTFGRLAGPPATRNLVTNYQWQKDSEVHTCQKCHTKFGVFTRRHHCRECGRIFCDKCTKHRVTLDNPLTETGRSSVQGVKDCRVCDECYGSLRG